MPECAKTHLQQSRISKFSGAGPPDPPLQGRGGKAKGGEEREGKGRKEGGERYGREGMDGKGQGREGGREGTNGVGIGEGKEGRSTMARPPPPRDKLWIRPLHPHGGYNVEFGRSL